MGKGFDKPFIRKARKGMHEGRWVIAIHRDSRMVYEPSKLLTSNLSFSSQREAFKTTAKSLRAGLTSL